MEIRNKKIKDIIMKLFDSQGVIRKAGNNLEAFLKESPEKTYIRLYYDDHKIVLSEQYADNDYHAIKEHIKSELKHKPEKDLSDFSLEDLENLENEVKKEMEEIWFTADFHQGHRPMAESLWDGIDRPTNMENHDQWLLDIVNARVGKKDKLYILGDVSLRPRKEVEKFLNKMNGNKVLIFGNHDRNLKNSTVIGEKTLMKEFKYKRHGISIHIVLCHYPMVSWNRSVHGSWHLYGHVHGRYVHDRLAFDVGLDSPEMNHEPINLYEVAVRMVKKKKIMQEIFKG